ncbi:Transcription termination factor Rho [Clostridiaceae bacterium JG1575]|nr:Transcription termination factor Rho [Clostridiaceae bacterium JG1575]
MESDLKSLSLMGLRSIAKKKNIKNIARYRKQELLELLLAQEAPQGEPSPKEPSQGEAAGEPRAAGSLRTAPSFDSQERASKERKEFGIEVKSYIDRNGVELKERITPREEGDEPKEVRRITLRDDERESERNKEREEERENRENLSPEERVFPPDTMDVDGILEINDNNTFGFLRGENYLTTPEDIYVSPAQIRRFRLKTGDHVAGKTRPSREGDKFRAIFFVDTVNGDLPGVAINRREFESLTPIYPNEQLILEIPERKDMATRIIDLISPVGKGQRGLIVAPPKAGKTTILKKIAQHVHINNPEVTLIVLLIDERPEEVTDIKESIGSGGEVIFSTFDEDPTHHTKVAQMVLERAKRLVEHGKNVVILLDSLTRLSRAYNLTVTPSGRTLSGGLDPAALYMPKRFFGAARNIRYGGSLTILATCLVDTGSRMDDMIFEEFKGTGNMEVHLDRRLQERRIFPAIDLVKSGTRKEELMLSKESLEAVRKIRALLNSRGDTYRYTEQLISMMVNSSTNREFIETLKKVEEPSRELEARGTFQP